ncbi:hypothetical protein DESC_290187 [Desulfosarcina cetonica]|nr:hypothetical protein DESC_290187 [Desulfosarcina cetonica]
MNKIDHDPLVINIPVKAYDMDLYREYVVIEGGAEADVGHSGVAVAFMLDDDGIDAQFGAKLILQDDIGRGNPQKSAATVAAMGHSSADLIIASQHARGLDHLAIHDQLADTRAADAFGIAIGGLDPVGHDNDKPHFLTELFEKMDVPLAVVAEGIIVADDNDFHADAADEDFLDKGSR